MSATHFTVRTSRTPLIDDDGEDEPIRVNTNTTIDNEPMLDIVADSTHSGGSNSVTLLPEEVLRLTEAESGRILINNHHNTGNNNSTSAASAVPPSLHTQISQATSEDLPLSRVDSNENENDSGELNNPPSVTLLPTEQVLQLTMNNEDDDLVEDNSRNNNPADSYPRQTTKNKKTERKKPKRSKSGNSTGSAGKLKKAVKKEKKSMDAVVAAAIRNYGGSVPNNSEGGGDNDRKDTSLRKSRTSGKKKNKRHSPNKNKSGQGSSKASEETPGTASSPIKKKRRGRRPQVNEEKNGPVQGQHQPEVPSEKIDREAEDLPVDENNEEEDDYDIEAPLPPQLSEQISSASIQSFQSIDRAGAIAVYPSDSSHITQRRSINRPINDIDNSFEFNQIVVEENARRESSSRDLTSTLKSFEEIPEPPESQVINATATHFYSSSATPPRSSLPPQPHSSSATTTALSQSRTQMPTQLPMPSVGSPSWTPSTATSITNQTSTTQSSLSQPSTYHNLSQDSSADNSGDFLTHGSVGDAGSGTITAKAISSQDYYEEVRRQLQEEAVVAVDVIPLTEGRLPVHNKNTNVISSSGAKVYSTNSGQNGKIDYNDDGPGSNFFYRKRIQKKYLWIFGAIGILIVALIIVLAIFANQRNSQNTNITQLRTQAPSSDSSVPAPTNEPTGNPRNSMTTPMGLYWREVITDILPKSTLQNILFDPEHMSPHYMAFSYLVENAQELFHIYTMEETLTERAKSKVSTVFGLVMLYYCMDGPNWFVNTNWLRADVSFCHWHGVNCKGDLIPKQNYQNLDAINNESREYGIPFGELLDIPPPGDIDDLVMMGETTTAPIGTDDGFFNSPVFNEGADDDRQEGEEYNKVYDRDDDFTDETWDEFFDDKIPIHSLDLKANNLKGVLPDEIGLLTNIYGAIDLSINEIAGSIPTEFGMLSKLQCMLLHSNDFEKALPSELGTMTNLRKFDISSNTAITGSVPDTLANWNRIEELEIQDTGLTGSIPAGICQTLESRSIDFIFKHVNELAFRASCSSLDIFLDGEGVDCMCCTECCYRDDKSFEQCTPPPVQEDD